MPTPSRRRVVPALAALSTGLLLILSGCSSRPDGAAPPVPTPAATQPAPTPAATATADPAPVPVGNGTASSPAPRPPTGRPTTGRPTTARPATARPAQPAGTTSTRYAQLVDVWHTGPSSYALVYDRVEFLTGPAAAAYYREHPDQEPLDFAIANPGPELTQLPVAAKGTFYGNQQLGPGDGSRIARITGDQLIARLKTHPRTLVKVTERPAANHPEVVEIAEVYLP